MKILDKHTIRNNGKWRERETSQFPGDWDSHSKKERKKLKTEIREFSYFVTDKIWWNSLTDEDKEGVYHDQKSKLDDYKYRSGIKIISNDWYRDWLEHQMIYLKSEYLPQVDVKRNLVIEELLKNEI